MLIHRIPIEPLTRETFAPFGEVVELKGRAPLSINQGFADRFDDLADIDVSAAGGAVNVSVFQARRRPSPIAIALMERHPLASQLFYPLQDKPWLIAVCADPRQPASFRAYAASGRQGVNYARGVWHHPLLALDDDSLFLVVDRKGPGDNLDETRLDHRLCLAP